MDAPTPTDAPEGTWLERGHAWLLAAPALAEPVQLDRPGDTMPDRHWDFVHLDLAVDFDIEGHAITGVATHTVRPLDARSATLRPITDVAGDLGIEGELVPYGRSKAKVDLSLLERLRDQPRGKLVLVTAISPTPAGEGKTTTTVGLGDGLNAIGKKACICIREASLGPNFGMKGGRCGRRLCAGRSDGGHEPSLHRRLPRDHLGAFAAERDDRQPYLLGQ